MGAPAPKSSELHERTHVVRKSGSGKRALRGLPSRLWHPSRLEAPGRLKTKRFVPVEVRIVAGEKEAFEPFGLGQYFARHALSLDLKIIEEPVDKLSNLAMYHSVFPRPLDIKSGGLREQPEFIDRVLSSSSCECLSKLAVPIRHG